jgi:hypothetical protein
MRKPQFMKHPLKTREASTNHYPRGVHKYSMRTKENKKTIEMILHKRELSFYNEEALAFLCEATIVF